MATRERRRSSDGETGTTSPLREVAKVPVCTGAEERRLVTGKRSPQDEKPAALVQFGTATYCRRHTGNRSGLG